MKTDFVSDFRIGEVAELESVVKECQRCRRMDYVSQDVVRGYDISRRDLRAGCRHSMSLKRAGYGLLIVRDNH